MRIFISILFLLFSLYSYSQTVELYPGWRVDVTSIVTTSDSTYNVSFSINHPYNTYNGNDVQLNDVLYTNSVSYGDDCNEYIVTNIIDQFAGELVVTVTDKLSQGIPAQGIGVLVRLSESGLTHWIANVGDPLNQCISAKLAGSIENKFVDIENQIDSIYAGTFSMYISDSISTAQLITEDTMFIIGDAVQLDGNRFRIITPSAVVDTNTFLLYVDSAGVKTDSIFAGDTIFIPASTGGTLDTFVSKDSFYVNNGDSIIFVQQGDTIVLPTFTDTDTDSIYFNNGDTTILILRKDTITITQDGNIDSFYVYFGVDSVVYIQQGDTIFLADFVPPPPPEFPDSLVNCTTPTEIVDVINPVTGRTWMDRNLGASQKATSSTDAAAYGDLYQWGRFGDGHQCRINETTTTLATTAEPFTGGAWDSLFIFGSNDWLTSQNDNLWQGVDGINNPCPSGYRLPTESEWDEERLSWNSNNSAGAFESPLKLPLPGFRFSNSGAILNANSYGNYWSSSISGSDSRYLFIYDNNNTNIISAYRTQGFAVRCIKEPSGFTTTDTIINSFKAGYLYDADDTTAIRPIVIDNDIYFQLNEEAVEDVVAEMFNNQIHENITITYDDSEASNLILRAVDTSGRNQSLTITNDTLFLTDADTTLKVLLPQVVDTDTDTDSIYVNNDGVINLITRGDTIVLPVFVDTNNDSIYFDNNGVITLAERNDTIVLPVDTNTDTDTLYFNLGGVLYQQTRNDTLNIPVAIDTSFANQDTVFFVSGGDTTFVVLPPPDGDDWGDQFVITDSTLSGKGTVTEPLTVNYLPDLVFDGDSSVTNELQDIDSVVLLDNLLTVYISDGAYASVDLSGITLTDRADTSGYNLTFQLNGNDLELADGAGQLSVNLSAYLDNTDTDSIIIDSLGTLLVKQRGDIITLIPDTDTNTDEQNLSLSGDSLLIERGTGVDLSKYLDNTDTSGYNQSLTFANGQLTITDGNNSLIVTIPDSVGGFVLPTDSITFNNNEAGPDEAELNWDETLGYLVFGGVGNQLIQIGQDQYWMTVNQSGDLIEKGEVVRAAGATGNSGKFLIEKYLADGNTDPNYLLGVAAHDIPNGTEGYVMHQGKIRQIDLTAYNTGQVLYVSPTVAGDWVTAEPGNGYQKLPIAFVVDSSANGTLAVRVKTGEALRDLHDVDVSGVTDNQIIKYDADLGYWTLSNDEDTQLTEEQVEDFVGGMLTGTQTGITVTYQDDTDDIDFVVADISPTNEIQGLTLTNDGDDRFTIGLSGNSNTVNLLEGNNVNLSYKDTLGGNSIVVDINQAFPYGRQGISVEDTNTVKLGFATKEDAILVNNAIGAVGTAAPRFIDIEQVGLGTRLEFMQSPSTGYSSAYADSSFIRFSAHDFYLGQAAERASNVEFDWYYNSQVQSPQPPYDFSDYNLGYKTRLRQRVTWGDFATGPVNYKFEIDSDGDIRLTPGDDLELMNIPNDDTDVNVLTIDNNVVSYRAVSSLPDNNNYVNSITMSDGNNDDTWDITLGRVGLADVTTTVNLSEYVNDPTNLSFSGAASPYTLNSSTGNDVTFAAGTGITLSESSNQLTITNASPDQVVSLTAGNNVSITGTYPTFTINSSFTDTDTRVNVFEGATSKTTNTTKLTFDANDFDVAASGTEATVSVNFPADNNTTYDLSAEASVSNPSIILTPSSGTADEVNLIGGTNVTIQSDGSNNITISSTDQNTTYSSSQGIDDANATDFKLGETVTWTNRANSINAARSIYFEDAQDQLRLVTEDNTVDGQFIGLSVENNITTLSGNVFGAGIQTKSTMTEGAAPNRLVFGTNIDGSVSNDIISDQGNLNIKVKQSGQSLNVITNSGDITFNSNDLLIRGSNGYVGIQAFIPSEELHINGDMRLEGEFRDGNNEAGTSGQILSSTGSITDWKSLADLGIQPAGSYLTTETDPIFGASASAGITSTNISNWNTAYGWGDHSTAGYLTSQTSHADVVVDGDFTSQGIMLRGATAGSYSILTNNSSNWNTAYSWGDHALEGYLTSEVDGSVSNEGSLSVGAGTSTTSLIQSNTSGSSAITLQAGTNITLSESSNTITINATGDGTGTDDQNISGSSFTPSTGNLVIGIENGTNETVNLDGRYLTSNQNITLSGDATGSGTTSISVTVVDDSHNHVISNVDGLQSALDGKASTSHNHTLDGLSNTTITSNSNGEILKWNGTAWINNTLAEAGIQPAGNYLTGNQTITLGGDVSGSGTTSITVTVSDDSHNHVISNVDGLQTALDGKQPLDADLTTIGGLAKTDGNFIVGNGTTWVVESGSTARTSLGLGSLATLSAVGSSQITDNSVSAIDLNVSGNGTTAQFLRSDGDGSFTWATPTDNNTTYSAGAGLTLSGTTFSANTAPVTNGAATLATGDQIYDFVTGLGYTSNTGDITGVTAGTGLSGGGSSGTVTLNVDLSELTDMTAAMIGTDEFIVLDGGADRRKAANEINVSIFNNDAGYTSNTGDITGVTAGNQLTGGGTSGTVTLNVSEGAGSGLDADLLDGQQGSYYYPASNPNGYTTNTGDITGVTAGIGLDGGASSGTATLNLGYSSLTTARNNQITSDRYLDFNNTTGLIINRTATQSTSVPALSLQSINGLATGFTNTKLEFENQGGSNVNPLTASITYTTNNSDATSSRQLIFNAINSQIISYADNYIFYNSSSAKIGGVSALEKSGSGSSVTWNMVNEHRQHYEWDASSTSGAVTMTISNPINASGYVGYYTMRIYGHTSELTLNVSNIALKKRDGTDLEPITIPANEDYYLAFSVRGAANTIGYTMEQ